MTVALNAADAADEIAMAYFGGDFDVERKADESPVTAADRKAEEAIREVISASFPDHALYGEEYGRSEIGRASCRERVCDSGVAGAAEKEAEQHSDGARR